MGFAHLSSRSLSGLDAFDVKDAFGSIKLAAWDQFVAKAVLLRAYAICGNVVATIASCRISA